jgi:hypothetical protein
MLMISDTKWPDEAPTKDAEYVPCKTAVYLARIGRLAELASERIMCAPSDADLESAVGCLDQIRRLATEVLR